MLNSYPYQVSIQNVLAQGPSLGYSTNDLVCLCKNTNLAYGTRDFAKAFQFGRRCCCHNNVLYFALLLYGTLLDLSPAE